jgi:ABC-2 type transport system permease protein
MKAFLKLLASDLKQFTRDRTALFFAFAFPILFMLLFGLIFNNAKTSFTIGVADEDNTPISQSVVDSLGHVTIFKIDQANFDQGLADLKSGKTKVLVVIPSGLSTAVATKTASNIEVYYDPADTTDTPVILSVLQDAVGAINQQVTQTPVLLTLEQKSISTHQLKYIDFLVPGILAMSIMFLGLFGAMTMVARREKMVLKRFGATPIKPQMVVISQVVYRLIVALVQTSIIILIARFVFNVNMVGNWFLLAGFVLLGTVTLVSIGYFIVARARTVEAAQPIIQLVQFPMMFLSGIFFPMDILPAAMKPVVNAMPLTYLGDAFRQIMVDSTPIHALWLDAAVLGAWLVVCMILAIKLFKWD